MAIMNKSIPTKMKYLADSKKYLQLIHCLSGKVRIPERDGSLINRCDMMTSI